MTLELKPGESIVRMFCGVPDGSGVPHRKEIDSALVRDGVVAWGGVFEGTYEPKEGGPSKAFRLVNCPKHGPLVTSDRSIVDASREWMKRPGGRWAAELSVASRAPSVIRGVRRPSGARPD